MRKRPSSAGPPRPDRERSPRRAEAASPWPGSTSAVHARATSADDPWTIVKIVEQLGVDRGQIAMLKETVENLHAARLQDAADQLDLSTGVDARDSEHSQQTIDI